MLTSQNELTFGRRTRSPGCKRNSFSKQELTRTNTRDKQFEVQTNKRGLYTVDSNTGKYFALFLDGQGEVLTPYNENVITIDLFSARQADLSIKASKYKERHASPEVSVHERLFARAMEKETKAKIEADQPKLTKPISYVNKVSKELLKSRCSKPGTAIDVTFAHYLDAISRFNGEKEESRAGGDESKE